MGAGPGLKCGHFFKSFYKQIVNKMLDTRRGAPRMRILVAILAWLLSEIASGVATD